MNTALVIKEYVDNNKSINQIAKEFNTYPAKIFRLLKKEGIEIRGKSEAQKNALKSGISVHPTEGKEMSDEAKAKISQKNARAWANKSEKERAEFVEMARANWKKKTVDERIEMSKLAGAGLRKASVEGSRAENYLRDKLEASKYNVEMHRKNIGGQYEVDLYLPEYAIAIEVDGPQHFLPVFGEEKLQRNIKFDTIKNGILLGKGIKIIRVKYIKKHTSQKVLSDLWKAVSASIESIVNGTNETNLIEIEV